MNWQHFSGGWDEPDAGLKAEYFEVISKLLKADEAEAGRRFGNHLSERVLTMFLFSTLASTFSSKSVLSYASEASRLP